MLVIGLLPTVQLETTLDMCASINAEKCKVVRKYDNSFNVIALLSILLDLKVVINLALWNALIELLQSIFVPNSLVPILTFDVSHIDLIIPCITSIQTPVLVWTLLVLKLLLVVVITLKI